MGASFSENTLLPGTSLGAFIHRASNSRHPVAYHCGFRTRSQAMDRADLIANYSREQVAMSKRRKSALKSAFVMEIQPYGGLLFATRDKEHFKGIAAELGMCADAAVPDYCDGFYYREGAKYIIYWSHDVGIETLVHEVCHVALAIADDTVWDPRECNGEPFCYLVDHMVRTVLGYDFGDPPKNPEDSETPAGAPVL